LCFGAFLSAGFKKAAKYFNKNSMSKTFCKTNPSVFLVVSHLEGVSRQGEFTNTINKKSAEAHVDKFLQKRPQKLQCRISLGFVYRVFGRFSARGVHVHGL
jgi:hypothetical protein